MCSQNFACFVEYFNHTPKSFSIVSMQMQLALTLPNNTAVFLLNTFVSYVCIRNSEVPTSGYYYTKMQQVLVERSKVNLQSVG